MHLLQQAVTCHLWQRNLAAQGLAHLDVTWLPGRSQGRGSPHSTPYFKAALSEQDGTGNFCSNKVGSTMPHCSVASELQPKFHHLLAVE